VERRGLDHCERARLRYRRRRVCLDRQSAPGLRALVLGGELGQRVHAADPAAELAADRVDLGVEPLAHGAVTRFGDEAPVAVGPLVARALDRRI
jgi:hypothetical protein